MPRYVFYSIAKNGMCLQAKHTGFGTLERRVKSLCRSSKEREKQSLRYISRQIRRHVLVQRDPKRSTIRQKSNLKVVRDGNMGSGKHTNVDITLGFKGPSLGQNTRDIFKYGWWPSVNLGWMRMGSKTWVSAMWMQRKYEPRGWESWALGPRAQAGKLFSPGRNCPTHFNATETFLTKVLKTKTASCEWSPPRAKMLGLPFSASSEQILLPDYPAHHALPPPHFFFFKCALGNTVGRVFWNLCNIPGGVILKQQENLHEILLRNWDWSNFPTQIFY